MRPAGFLLNSWFWFRLLLSVCKNYGETRKKKTLIKKEVSINKDFHVKLIAR